MRVFLRVRCVFVRVCVILSGFSTHHENRNDHDRRIAIISIFKMNLILRIEMIMILEQQSFLFSE